MNGEKGERLQHPVERGMNMHFGRKRICIIAADIAGMHLGLRLRQLNIELRDSRTRTQRCRSGNSRSHSGASDAASTSTHNE
jgi:hypothetical protein